MSEQAKQAFADSLKRKKNETEKEHETRLNELTKQMLSDEIFDFDVDDPNPDNFLL